MLEQVISILTDPDEPVDTRDGFFCSYKSSKQTPIAVFNALVSGDDDLIPFYCFLHKNKNAHLVLEKAI